MSTTIEKDIHMNSKPGSGTTPLEKPIHHPKKNTTKLKLEDEPSEKKAETITEDKKLTKEEIKQLAACKKVLDELAKKEKTAFFEIAGAIAVIKSKRLYRETHDTFEGYIIEGWGYSRSHAKRLAGAGDIIARKSLAPHGATVLQMSGESFFRPLAKLEEAAQDAVIDLLGTWKAWDQHERITPRMVEGAVLYLYPPAGPKPAKPNPLIASIVAAVDEVKKQIPKGTNKEIKPLFEQIKKKALALGNPKRSTGIDWTDATWNPLQGCARKSAGCDNCYAAQLVATRLAHVYPGLASEVKKDKATTYIFNNIIRLLPEQLGDPLRDLVPRRYFVNSMSDLFHDKVPEAFITAVFDVMTKAHWHQFQVLTKRPERMAEFTIKYFAGKQPPANIWLGTSTEDQKALDERLPHLLKVVAAVRWLSLEPLIGPIEFDSLDGIDWVVVGGESGKGARKMELAWATTVRDACVQAGVSFFFKQWGAYGADGKKLKKAKKDGLTPPALEGVIHDAYPQPRIVAGEKVIEAEIISETPVATKTGDATPADEAGHQTGDAVPADAPAAPTNETETAEK